MKLSCLPVSLYDDLTSGQKSLTDWLDFAAELGLDGADLSIAHLQDADISKLDQLRQHAEGLGIQIAMLVTYSDFTHPDADERLKQVALLKAHIDMAERLEASTIRVTAGQAHPGVSREAGIDWAVDGLTACLDYADQANITLAYENHTIGYGWTQFDFSRPADIFQAIVAQTEGTALQVLFDTANNLAYGDDPLAVFAQVKHRIAVIHLSDIRRAGHFEPVVLGTGVAPNKDILEQVQVDGFDGWISIEEASKTGEAGFWEAAAWLRSRGAGVKG